MDDILYLVSKAVVNRVILVSINYKYEFYFAFSKTLIGDRK